MIKNIKNVIPINLKTVLIIIFLLILYFGPVKNQDIIADLFVLSFASLIALIGILVITTNTFILKNVEVSISNNNDSTTSSNVKIPYSLLIRNARLLPFLKLELNLAFNNSDFLSPSFILNNIGKKSFDVIGEITFPHRGIWQVKHVKYKLSDQFGLFSKAGIYNLKENADFQIIIDTYSNGNFPIASSIEKEGDDFESNNYPQGDPLELKAYHPSDGLKKIAWKIYARNQILISRHPERAMSPEGTIAITALATKDDSAARLSLNYINKVTQSEMLVNFNCLGATKEEFAHNFINAEKMLINSVWEAELSLENLSNCLNSHLENSKEKQIANLVIIISDSDCVGSEKINLISSLISEIKSKAIAPIIFIASSEEIKTEKLSSFFEMLSQQDIKLHTEVNYYE